MQTLMIRDGDLSLASGTFETVRGGDKLYQDLSHAVREPIGTDRFHPGWGSSLPNFIGGTASPATGTLVQNEVRRVVRNHAAVQQSKMTIDAQNRRRSRFGTGEVIKEIGSIQVRAEYDRLHVRCLLSTLSGAEVALVATVRT